MTPGTPQKIFLALPTMGSYNGDLIDRLIGYSQQQGYRIMVDRITGELFHDSARNKLCARFLQSEADWLLFIDEDVDPNPKLLDLTKHDKDIIAGNVLAWMPGKNPDGTYELELYSSIWERADCEECKAVAQFKKDGSNKDPREYKIEGEVLWRWNPLGHIYEPFHTRDGFIAGKHCRCHGTGRDPLVYNPSSKLDQPAPIQVDGVGAAAMMIRRRVIETIKPPWFQFLYREMRDVMATEDLMFCVKAKQYGFEVWADQNMPCRHFKPVDLLAMNQWGARLQAKSVKALVEKMEQQKQNRIIVPGMAAAFR